MKFYAPTLKIRGKCVNPKRLVSVYGDANFISIFSGTFAPANPWTSLMLDQRDCKEKFTFSSFIYVLLNQVIDRTKYVSQHKDNKTGFDAIILIFVVSFGGEKTNEFKKFNTPSVFIEVERGSLFSLIYNLPRNCLLME